MVSLIHSMYEMAQISVSVLSCFVAMKSGTVALLQLAYRTSMGQRLVAAQFNTEKPLKRGRPAILTTVIV
jgi:hypothetical protein